MENESQLKHTLISAALSVAFVVSLALFAFPVPIFRYMVASFSMFLILATFYNVYRFQSLKRDSLWSVCLIMLFYGSFGTLFFLAPNHFLQYVFLGFSLIAVYLQQRIAVNIGENILASRVILTSAAFFLVISASANFYFKLPGIVYLAIVFIFCSGLSRAAYEYTPLPSITKFINALVVGLLTAEMFWALSFLPFHYSVLGLLGFCVFYFIWQLDYAYIFQTLTAKRVAFTSILLLTTILIVLAFTPWKIIS